MNGQKMSPTESAHQDLKKVLFNSRILLNGMPLTGNEISGLLQGEQMLYEKATQTDKVNQLAAAKKAEKEKTPKKKE